MSSQYSSRVQLSEVNSDTKRPMISVTAKPRMGPEALVSSKTIPAISAVTWPTLFAEVSFIVAIIIGWNSGPRNKGPADIRKVVKDARPLLRPIPTLRH